MKPTRIKWKTTALGEKSSSVTIYQCLLLGTVICTHTFSILTPTVRILQMSERRLGEGGCLLKVTELIPEQDSALVWLQSYEPDHYFKQVQNKERKIAEVLIRTLLLTTYSLFTNLSTKFYLVFIVETIYDAKLIITQGNQKNHPFLN